MLSNDIIAIQEEARHNPVVFIENFFLVQSFRGPFKPTLYPHQKKLLRHVCDHPFSIGAVARQMGSTMLMCGYFLWLALFKKDTRILIDSHQYSNTKEIFNQISFAVENIVRSTGFGSQVCGLQQGRIMFQGESFIQTSYHCTDDLVSSSNFTNIYAENLAFFSDRKVETLIATILKEEVLSFADGHLKSVILISTPYFPKGLFYDLWQDADRERQYWNGFRRIKLDYREHPDRTASWAFREKGIMGQQEFARAFECQFF